MKQKTKYFLLAWIVILILPMVWVVRINPQLDLWFNTFFAPEWMHVFAHWVLYMVVGLLTPWVFFDHLSFKKALPGTLLVVLGVGLVQETFQLMVKQRGVGRNEIFDLMIDLLASTLGFLLYWLLLKKIPTRKH